MTFHECLRCRVIYRSATVADEKYDRDYFSNHAHESVDTGVPENQRTRITLARGLSRGGSLLDIGTARGGSLQAARELGWTDLRGIDCTDEFLEELSAQEFRVQVGDAHELPFEQSTFDTVLMSHVLEHLDRPLIALQEVRRVLKPMGIALITVPNADYWRARLRRGKYKWYRLDREGRFHHTYFTLNTLAESLEECGLEPVTFPLSRLFERTIRSAMRSQKLSRWKVMAARFCDPLCISREISIAARKAA